MTTDTRKDLIREICQKKADTDMREARVRLQNDCRQVIADFGLAISTEDMFNCCAQASGMSHPAIVKAVETMADARVEAAIVNALDRLSDRPPAKAGHKR